MVMYCSKVYCEIVKCRVGHACPLTRRVFEEYQLENIKRMAVSVLIE